MSKKAKNRKIKNWCPDRKISETLIDFARPVVELIDENTSLHRIEKGFMLAVTIWNAIVFDTVNGDTKYLDKILKLNGNKRRDYCYFLFHYL